MTSPTVDESAVRLRLDLAYDGTDFSGWADQPGRRTVQGTLEAALATVTRLPAVRLTVAGRTDAGVHARGQVAHVDLPAGVAADPDALARRLGRLLPDDVRVRQASVAPAGFDARFSAVWRRYAYRICDDAASADPLVRRHVLSWPRRLDEIAMDEAGRLLCGEHDFAAYCRKREGATTIRALRELAWSRDADVLTGRSWPTRSATTWSARWSARSSLWGRVDTASPGRPTSCAPGSVIHGWVSSDPPG